MNCIGSGYLLIAQGALLHGSDPRIWQAFVLMDPTGETIHLGISISHRRLSSRRVSF